MKKLKHSNTKLSTIKEQFLQSYITKVLNQVDKERTKLRCQFCLFQVEAWKWQVLKHRRRLYLLTAASMSPFSAMFFVGPQQDYCSPPQASSSFHVVFVVLPPSFVSPKLQVFNQRLIWNFLWVCPWTQYPTTPISCGTQSTVCRNCPLCHRCFRNIPLQNTLPTIAFQLIALLSFSNRRL